MSEYLEHPSVRATSITHLHPWSVIKHRLGQELDTDASLLQKLKYQLQEEIAPETFAEITDSEKYFTCLESKFESLDELLDYLIYQFEHLVTLHIDLGSIDVAELLKTLKEELVNVQSKLERDGMLKDTKFIGRSHHIQYIQSVLFQSEKVKGVCICGLGGLGKTSLAKEICIQQGLAWNIHTIDLREKNNVKDLLHATMDSYQHFCHGDSVRGLEDQLFDLLRNLTNKKEILLYDNVDDIINVNEEQFTRFVSDLLEFLDEMGSTCKIRVLITSRQKLKDTSIEHELKKRKKKFRGLLEEVELEPLKPEDAQRLFDLCTEKVSLPLRNRIVELCGFSPLAIRTISSVIKDGNITPKQVISSLQAAQTSSNIPEISGIFTCLQQAFENLDISYRKKLIRLSIFQAAPFDIYAAAKILEAYEMSKNKPIIIDAQLTLLYLKRHHLVEIDKIRHSSSDTEDTAIKPISTSSSLIQYSFHPLVSAFLKEQSRTDMYSQDINDARKRFVAHFKVVINKFGRLEEKNYLKAQRIMEKNKVHLLYFFKLLESSPEREVEVQCFKSRHEDIITAKRIADIVAMMVDDYERLRFVRKAYESSIRRQDILCAILWRVQEGTLLYEMDRCKLATDVLREIDELLPSDEGYEEDAMAAVLGHFYYLKGRVNVEIRDFTVAIESLQIAEKFYKSIKSEKKNYISYLARVYNAMGNIYYKRKPINIKMAKMFYEKALQLVLSRTDNEYKNLDIPCYLTQVGTCSYRQGVQLEEQREDPSQHYREALKCYNIAISCDLQMKMRESEDFAHKLCRKACVLARLGKLNHSEEYFKHAEEDIRESLRLRRSLLAPPHENITLTTHLVGDILKMKAAIMYENKKEAYKVINVIFEARVYYQETLDLMKDGGLDKDHPEYQKIKENHLWLERQVDEPGELKKIKRIYKKFEEGFYDERAEARQSMEATIVDHMSREEKMKLLHSSDDRWQHVQNWRTGSDSDEGDVEISHDPRDEEDCLHLLDAIKLQTVDYSNVPSEDLQPANQQPIKDDEMDKDEVFEAGNENRSYISLDDGNSFISFLENYVPSFSEEFGEDFWHLISDKEGEVSNIDTEEMPAKELEKSRKRAVKESTHPKREKKE